MSVELEDRIRTSLHRRADAIHVTVPEPHLVRPFTTPRRSRRTELVAVAAALLLFVGAGVLVALAGRDGADPVNAGPGGVTPGSVPAAPTVGELGRAVEPGALVAMPAPWRMDRLMFTSAHVLGEMVGGGEVYEVTPDGRSRRVDPTDQTSMLEYRFTDGSRALQVNFYELGLRDPQITTPEPPLVAVRGTTGHFLDYGGGRYRVQWDEAGRTWEVDGQGFSSLDEVVAVLATLEWQDDATWTAGAPAGLAAALAANALGSVSWSAEGGLVTESGETPTRSGPATTLPPTITLLPTTTTSVEPATTSSGEGVVTTEVPAGPPSTTATTAEPSPSVP